MTETAAENLLVEIYGLSRDKAASLIEIPDAPQQLET